ncbi:unnamed protein product [Absidia cylindrospora]
MTTETIQSFDQQQQFNMNVDPSFHQATMAAAAGSAAAAQASSHHVHYPATTATGYFTHPYYQQHQQNYHPLMDPYHGDFRPTFYNPFEIKHRRRTSRAQLKVLEKSFLENAKPNATVRRYLAQELEMTPRGVQIWFQNRRAKAKLQKRKSQQQLSPTVSDIDTVIPNSNNNNNRCLMTSTPSSASVNYSSSSSLSPSSASAPDALFYSLDDIRSMTTSAQQPIFMPDQSWLAAPMHPLSTSSSHDGESTMQPRRQSCPLLSSISPLYNQADIQNRRVSDQSFSPSTPTTIVNGPGSGQTNGMTWTMDSADNSSCCSSTNGSGSSSCGTPSWSLDTFASAHQHSPLTESSLFNLYQQQQQLCLKPNNATTTTRNVTNALNLYATSVSSSSPSLSPSNYQNGTRPSCLLCFRLLAQLKLPPIYCSYASYLFIYLYN